MVTKKQTSLASKRRAAVKKRKAQSVKRKEAAKERTFQGEFFTQLLALATSAFGLTAALAWNQTIQGVFQTYIEPQIPGSGLSYHFMYAMIVTFVAVFITYQLSRIAARFSQKED